MGIYQYDGTIVPSGARDNGDNGPKLQRKVSFHLPLALRSVATLSVAFSRDLTHKLFDILPLRCEMPADSALIKGLFESSERP